MRNLRLRPGLSFGCVDGELIFLDIDRDRYFALRGEAASLFRSLIATSGQPSNGAFQSLIAAGLLEPAETPHPLRAAPTGIPDKSLFDDMSISPLPGFIAIAEIMARLVPIKRALARRQVAGRLRRIEALKEKVRQRPSRDPLHLAKRFNAARPVIPLALNCLSDSLALAEFLLRRGASADLVFGVKLTPFAAHAWVQTSDTILNDHVDHVREFTPVLVV